MNKICTKCKIDKPIEEYHHRKDRPIGYASICNQCQREKVKRYREINREAILLKDKDKRLDISYRLHRSCKHSARRRGLLFTLNIEDIVVPKLCSYLGIELTNTIGDGFQDYNPSIDRIDNLRGYEKGNIEVISVLANRMKSTATRGELLLFAKHILEKDATSKL